MRSLLLSLALLTAIGSLAQGAWTPPEKPDPTAVLNEARADARARRYEDALAKHVWYHENAEKIDEKHSSVRRTSALSSWYDLGADYPPALAKFEEVRASARQGVLDAKHPKHARNHFADYAAMNRELGEDPQTAELFLELRDKKSKYTKKLYRTAERALLAADRFDVCSEFLDAEYEMELKINGYKLNMKLADERDERFGERLRKFGERSFRNGAATIVVILVKNDRADEAKRLAQQARDAWDDEELNKTLDEALAGKKPKEFP